MFSADWHNGSQNRECHLAKPTGILAHEQPAFANLWHQVEKLVNTELQLTYNLLVNFHIEISTVEPDHLLIATHASSVWCFFQ